MALYGVSMAFFVEGALGVMPWDVLHQGLVRLVPVSLGTMTILAGAVVLLLWIPLRQMPGLGTVSNVVVIGLVVDLALRVLPTPGPLVLRAVFVAVGVGLNAVATAAYIGARFGPGPRDGLMTGLVARTGWPVRVVRTAIEVSVVGLGWLLGGNFGVGTLLYALAVGPLVQPLLPLLRVAEPEPAGRADAPAGRP
ncbi:YitT family protein [Kineosporia sp. A_224]|uniref:membrane protein YczE n=1 Tax=Kineosporia sp. A_224 TaxID=1962180 RepID=UPI003510ABA4